MTSMTARQRAALACLRINHPRAHVAPLACARDKDPLNVKVKMTWRGHYSRIVWIKPDGAIHLGETHIRDRQLVAA